ncbi:glycerate kinase [Brevibacillus porteri]|uniref:Glycerate kinase n=1 Tax=Brevibacillus porteri TaxID=2126350 RepID=A0ABX5FNZ8_9BACL|nr:glycerate kinase [Brevibacillus porteri]MED1797051.1 glycerate kinase [Brevibacillus porteri]MED2129804.1 glycerate kinase [Brevibacillus porteri]MED2744680.1 glycerate kinase [Brevibacillus porteri]MED2814473.1 glycerate kinase [Brevibacillus porteri]MED2893897.1 glycerate kinase [Brevibacillus porteri]
MKIVIAPDSFKGSLTAKQVGEAIRSGIRRVLPQSELLVKPMADGGEGTMQCLVDATDGRILTATVNNPLGQDISAEFGILGDGVTCVIEMAAASGLYLISAADCNPLVTTTYGFGQLITAGLDQGCRKFILGLGGSSTNDGGAGMLQALGFLLLDQDDQPLSFGGGELSRLSRIDTSQVDKRLADCQFVIACDVTNPFVGPNGASHVFGPQKGATTEMVLQLDDHLRHFADLIEETRGIAIHDLPGTGAAGGVAGALLAFLNGQLRSGIEIVIETTGLAEAMDKATLVITGEGQVDFQTAQGKTPCGVAQVAKRYGIPVIVLAGSIGTGIDALYEEGVSAVVSITNKPMTLDQSMREAASLLEQTAEQVMRIYSLKS